MFQTYRLRSPFTVVALLVTRVGVVIGIIIAIWFAFKSLLLGRPTLFDNVLVRPLILLPSYSATTQERYKSTGESRMVWVPKLGLELWQSFRW